MNPVISYTLHSETKQTVWPPANVIKLCLTPQLQLVLLRRPILIRLKRSGSVLPRIVDLTFKFYAIGLPCLYGIPHLVYESNVRCNIAVRTLIQPKSVVS